MRLQLIVVGAVLAGACDDGEPISLDAPALDSLPVDAAVDAAVDAPALPRLCDSETRDDTYVANLTKMGANDYQVVLASATPPPPMRGNQAWSVQVLGPGSVPMSGMGISVIPFMPDHGHGTAVQAIVTPGATGSYTLNPVNLFMAGLWTVRLDLRTSPTTPVVDSITFAFCVN